MFIRWFGSTLLLVKLCCHVGLGYNIDTEFSQLFRGPSGSRFGVTAEIVKTVSKSWQVNLYTCKQCMFFMFGSNGVRGGGLENLNFLSSHNKLTKILLRTPPPANIIPPPSHPNFDFFFILDPRMFYSLVKIIIRKKKQRVLQFHI